MPLEPSFHPDRQVRGDPVVGCLVGLDGGAAPIPGSELGFVVPERLVRDAGFDFEALHVQFETR